MQMKLFDSSTQTIPEEGAKHSPLVLVFLSGFAGLVYEVLWMKQLGLLFGNTSQAAGATLAAFFGGLAVGSWLWGKRSAHMKNPLRAYAWLEVGIAVAALLYFVVLHGYHAIYPLLYQHIDSAAWLLLVKFVLALLLVFPPALFMGGTIPVMGQVVIAKPSEFGRRAALLYGINTLGAALGAYLAGFYFPLWLGFTLTCVLAMAITGSIAFLAFWLSRSTTGVAAEEPRSRPVLRAALATKGRRARATETADPCSADRRGRWTVARTSGGPRPTWTGLPPVRAIRRRTAARVRIQGAAGGPLGAR